MTTEFEKAIRDYTEGKPLRVRPVLDAIHNGVKDWKPGQPFPGGQTIRDVLLWMSDPANRGRLDYMS